MTQPVMLQSFKDEFDVDEERTIPAPAGDRLKQGDASENVGLEAQSKYRSGVGKLLHMMCWSRWEIMNRVRELSRFMSGATPKHVDAMRQVMACWDLEFPVLGDSNMSPQSSVTKIISFSLRALGPPIISKPSVNES